MSVCSFVKTKVEGGGVERGGTHTRAKTTVTAHNLLLLKRFRLHSISHSSTMAIPIVDLLTWLELTSVRVRGESWRLVLRLGSGEVQRWIIVLVFLEIFVEVLEHSDLGLLASCLRGFEGRTIR
jgi:hypothetical protein